MIKKISMLLFGLALFVAATQGAGVFDALEGGLSAFLSRSKRASSNELQTFRQQILNAHNSYRKKHCAPALQFDNTLNNQAQNYADHLAQTDTFQHSGTKGVGENLYASYSSQRINSVDGATAAKAWYDEIKYYNFANGGFSEQTGHFTQLVWKSSQKLGCGLGFNNGRTKAYVVCQYSPPGNYQGQYQSNVLQGSC